MQTPRKCASREIKHQNSVPNHYSTTRKEQKKEQKVPSTKLQKVLQAAY
jgi:hypothetical protein